MLSALFKLNPDFYPIAIKQPQILANGVKHIELVKDGYLTKDDFVLLYDKSSEILHSKNPFSSEGSVIQTGRSAKEWVSRIQRLVALHVVYLSDGRKWIVQIGSEGPVQQ